MSAAAILGEFLGAMIVAMLRHSNGAILRMVVEAVIIAFRTRHVDGKIDIELVKDLHEQIDSAFGNNTTE